MSQILKTSLLIVGGGPDGYVAAIRAGQLSIPTVLVESATLGGTCLNVGCIPPEALIHAVGGYLRARRYAGRLALGIQVQTPSIDIVRTVEWKDAITDRLTNDIVVLLKEHGVDVVQDWARIFNDKSMAVELVSGGSQCVEYEHPLLVAGSQNVELPIPSLGGKVISSTETLASGSLSKRPVVVGGGYIGLEPGTVYHKPDVEVTMVGAQPRILPDYDEGLTKPVAQALRKPGVELYLGHSLLDSSENGVRVRDGAGEEHEVAVDQVLIAVDHKPHSEGWNLESPGLDMNGRAMEVDNQCHTSIRDAWAIGDLAGESMLAHRATVQGEMVAELVVGKRRQFAPVAVPVACFTDPEVVIAGLFPEQAKGVDLDCLMANFPFAADGRTMTLEANEGFVRVVARRDNHLVVGWQTMSKAVSELSAALTQSLEIGARLEDIVGIIHVRPTLGEAVQGAALHALGRALYV